MDRISCVILDNDTKSREVLAEYCHSIPYVEVVGSYHSSERFVESLLNDTIIVRLNGGICQPTEGTFSTGIFLFNAIELTEH